MEFVLLVSWYYGPCNEIIYYMALYNTKVVEEEEENDLLWKVCLFSMELICFTLI